MKKILILFVFTILLNSPLYAVDTKTLDKECISGKLSSCTEIGKNYFKSDDYNNAIKYLENPCSQNDAKACTILGVIYATGNGTDFQIDYKKAIPLLNIGCNNNTENNEVICNMLGNVYIASGDSEENNMNATKAFKKSCDQNHLESCYMLGVTYAQSNNYASAQELFEKNCNENHSNSCGFLGSLYFEGKGVKKNYKKANELYSKACEGNDASSCNYLADTYANGLNVVVDYNQALGLYKKACEGGENLACLNFKDLYNKVCLTNPKKYCSKYE